MALFLLVICLYLCHSSCGQQLSAKLNLFSIESQSSRPCMLSDKYYCLLFSQMDSNLFVLQSLLLKLQYFLFGTNQSVCTIHGSTLLTSSVTSGYRYPHEFMNIKTLKQGYGDMVATYLLIIYLNLKKDTRMCSCLQM